MPKRGHGARLFECTMTLQYHLPEDTYHDWNSCEFRNYQVTPRQALVVEAVKQAVQVQGLFYSSDVYDFCIKLLKPNDGDRKAGLGYVERGHVGMDLYYARKYLDAQARFQKEDEAWARLKPQVGMKLGTLVFQDLKVSTSWVITAITDSSLSMAGKSGRNGVSCTCSALSVRYCMDRAFERAKRKDNFEAFCLAVNQPKRPLEERVMDLSTLSLGF